MRNLVGTLSPSMGSEAGVLATTSVSDRESIADIDYRGTSVGDMPGATLLVEHESGSILDANIAAADVLGLQLPELIGSVLPGLSDTWLQPGSPDSRFIHPRPASGTVRLLRTATPVVTRGKAAWLVSLIDVTAGDRAAHEARHEREFLANVIHTMPAAIFVKDMHDSGRYVLCTRTTEDMGNVPLSRVLGHTDADLFPPATAETFRRADLSVMASRTLEISEATVCRADGTIVVAETKKMLVPDEIGGLRYILGITEDITSRREMELRLAQVAMLDPLTGLANRMLFREKLRIALKNRDVAGGFVVLHCMDLDQFKGVNDTMGHAAGDLLLIEVGRRIEAACGLAQTVARLGGDEFAIIQGPIVSLSAATTLAERVACSLREPFTIGGKTFVIGSSAGLAVSPDHGTDPDTLARSADIALYGTKEQERGSYRYFETEMATRIQARHRLEEDLREALVTASFELFYQPIIDIGSHRIAGFEALLRWQHPTRGFIPPSVVIPVAEESGLIVQLGDWVLREACREAASWPGAFGISVNLSPVQFRNPGLAASVAAALLASGLQPSRLELEITESVMLTNNQANLNTLHDLRALGIKISLDDFGTGYSSLGYLSAFPFHKIKIDRSFVQDIGSGSNCLAIVRSVIKLADDLGMATTAEGVETHEQLDRLRMEGCTQAQGYLFDRPQPPEALVAIMESFAAA